jgi:hypothetical protein
MTARNIISSAIRDAGSAFSFVFRRSPGSALRKRKRLLQEEQSLVDRMEAIDTEHNEILAQIGVTPVLYTLIQHLTDADEIQIDSFLKAIASQKQLQDKIWEYVGWLIADPEYGIIRNIELHQDDTAIQIALRDAIRAVGNAFQKGDASTEQLKATASRLDAARTAAYVLERHLFWISDREICIRRGCLVRACEEAENVLRVADYADFATHFPTYPHILSNLTAHAAQKRHSSTPYTAKLLALLSQ